MYYYEDYSQKEIAKLLHMNENTVACRLVRGRERLGKMLEEEEKKSSMGWKVAAAALLCAAIISMNFDSVVSYANTVIAKFGLIMGNEEVKLEV